MKKIAIGLLSAVTIMLASCSKEPAQPATSQTTNPSAKYVHDERNEDPNVAVFSWDTIPDNVAQRPAAARALVLKPEGHVKIELHKLTFEDGITEKVDECNFNLNYTYSNHYVEGQDVIKVIKDADNIAIKNDYKLLSTEARQYPWPDRDSIKLKTWKLSARSNGYKIIITTQGLEGRKLSLIDLYHASGMPVEMEFKSNMSYEYYISLSETDEAHRFIFVVKRAFWPL